MSAIINFFLVSITSFIIGFFLGIIALYYYLQFIGGLVIWKQEEKDNKWH